MLFLKVVEGGTFEGKLYMLKNKTAPFDKSIYGIFNIKTTKRFGVFVSIYAYTSNRTIMVRIILN